MKGIGEQSIFAFLLSFQNYFRIINSKGKVYWGYSFRLGGELYLSPMHSDIICLEGGQIIPLLFWKLVNEGTQGAPHSWLVQPFSCRSSPPFSRPAHTSGNLWPADLSFSFHWHSLPDMDSCYSVIARPSPGRSL